MQTDEWMAYSCSEHFSDQFSYKILFISRYQLKDMNYTRYNTFSEISWKNREKENVLYQQRS
jgi:hypothetical protein